MFIKVTQSCIDIRFECERLLNVVHIHEVVKNFPDQKTGIGNPGDCVIIMDRGNRIPVKETFEQVSQLIDAVSEVASVEDL